RLSAGPQWSHWTRLIRGEQPCGDPARLEIWGYTSQPSYSLGDELSLSVSTTADQFDIVIYRDGAREDVVHRERGIPGKWQETRARAYANGCGWEPSAKLRLSDGWKPGAYVVEFRAADRELS